MNRAYSLRFQKALRVRSANPTQTRAISPINYENSYNGIQNPSIELAFETISANSK